MSRTPPAERLHLGAPWLAPTCAAAVAVLCAAGCALEPTLTQTVDLGDQVETPNLALDEDFFHCVIQPDVLTTHSCAEGLGSDGGGCHTSRSALRLVEVTEPARCADGALLGAASPESELNLERVQVSVQVDPDSSPLYRRPIGLDSHPRVIFPADDPAAQAIRQWILMGAP